MRDYALNYRLKKCVIDGKDITYNEFFLLYCDISVKVSIPKEVKKQVVDCIDNSDCFVRIECLELDNIYCITLVFGDYLIPLNNKIFTDLELYILSK